MSEFHDSEGSDASREGKVTSTAAATPEAQPAVQKKPTSLQVEEAIANNRRDNRLTPAGQAGMSGEEPIP